MSLEDKIKRRVKMRLSMVKRRRWTKKEVELLKALYEYYPNYLLAKVFNRSVYAIQGKAKRLGLYKGFRGKCPNYIKAYYDRIMLAYIFKRVHSNEHGDDI